MLTICDIIPELNKKKKLFKVHCAIGPVDKLEAYYAYLKNDFKKWQENQTNKNFERKYILSLIYLNRSEWMFAGLFEKVKVKQKRNNWYAYETILMDEGKELIGRLIIKYRKTFRASYLRLENHFNQLLLCEIKKEPVTAVPFPGFENIIISYDYLKLLYDRNNEDWITALKSVKGVYLISDTITGKNYIGSAYGNDAIWQRWCCYLRKGHADNKKLKSILKKKGDNYKYNFKFSLLEIFAKTKDDEYIQKRESHWKNKLLTRQFGYNDN